MFNTEIEKAKNDVVHYLLMLGYETSDRVGCVSIPFNEASYISKYGFIWLGNNHVIVRNADNQNPYTVVRLTRAVVMLAFKNQANLHKKLYESFGNAAEVLGNASYSSVEECVGYFLNSFRRVSDPEFVLEGPVPKEGLRVENILASFAPKVAVKASLSSHEAVYITAVIKAGFLSRRYIARLLLENAKVSIQQLLGVSDHRRVHVSAQIEYNAESPITLQV